MGDAASSTFALAITAMEGLTVHSTDSAVECACALADAAIAKPIFSDEDVESLIKACTKVRFPVAWDAIALPRASR